MEFYLGSVTNGDCCMHTMSDTSQCPLAVLPYASPASITGQSKLLSRLK